MSINRVNISGNLTRDPELRQTQTGTAILSMGVAVNERTLNKQTNQWEDRPNFVDCILFGKRATGIQQYLRKGTKVAIDGKLRYSSWEKDGQRRSKLEVVVEEIEFMTANQAQNPQPAPQYTPQQQYAPAPQYQQAPQPAPAAPQYAPAPPQQTQQQTPQASQQQAPQYQQAPVTQPPACDVYDSDIHF